MFMYFKSMNSIKNKAGTCFRQLQQAGTTAHEQMLPRALLKP